MPGPFPYQSTASVPTSRAEIKFGSAAPVCDVTISSRGNLEVIPALLDSGASRTFIPHRIAISLNLRMIRDDVKITVADGRSELRPLFVADLTFAGLSFRNHPVVSIVRRDHILIGRDILNLKVTTLDGPQLQFSIE